MTIGQLIGISFLMFMVLWGFIIAAGILFIAWDLIRDWDARRRIRKLIAAEGLPDPNYVADPRGRAA